MSKNIKLTSLWPLKIDMYRIYPVSLPFGRSGGSQETIIVFIELITALISAGAEGAKRNTSISMQQMKTIIINIVLLSSSVLQYIGSL